MIKIILTLMVLALASPSFAEEKSSQTSFAPKWNQQAKKRHKKCLTALEIYFETEVSAPLMKEYFSSQYKVTVYRVFASFLAQRHEQNKNIADGVRSKKAVTRYSALIKERISEIEKTAKNDPKFQEAKRSFNDSPLSAATFAKLVPFLGEYISKETPIYENQPLTFLRLDRDDFKMLDLLASMDAPFIEKIEHLDESFIFNNELMLNVILIRNRIIERGMATKVYLLGGKEPPDAKTMIVPPECIDEKNDLSIAMNCFSCLKNKDESLNTLIQMSDEISQMLFNSLLSREDLKYRRADMARFGLKYVGTNGPWGNIRD